MKRFKILHRTYYNFSGPVQLGPHELRLRPREGHELHIESATLTINPPAKLRWYRDAEDNSVAIATFELSASQLMIESEVIIQQYNLAPMDFSVADYATHYPFEYPPPDRVILSPYLNAGEHIVSSALSAWVACVWQAGEAIQTSDLLQRLSSRIHQTLRYQIREEPGVQSVDDTLARGSGSCRDFASLFMEAARYLGLAARFVSGYLHTEPSPTNYGSTHAWAEVFLPGAGWTGFDPTHGTLVGADHFAVAVAMRPESVPPIAGTFLGPPGASLDVGVWVSELG